MGHLSALLCGLAKSLCSTSSAVGTRNDVTLEKSKDGMGGKEVVDAIARKARKDGLVLKSSGTMMAEGSNCLVSIFSKRGEKGVNQDCLIVWEKFGYQEDMIFCGIFDGHGSWGHYIAKSVRDSLPVSLLCSWQEALALTSLSTEFDLAPEKKRWQFDIWKEAFLRSCATVDEELEKNQRLDSFHSGTTGLTIIKQGELLVIANVGDSRAVLATTDDDGTLISIPLTYEHRPNLPEEANRITQCKGRVFCLDDEPEVHRLWLPDGESPGLAMSRAFGDHYVKKFGLVSIPEVTQRNITSRDQFLILATDGVWDVISNEEAVGIVSTTPEKSKSAKRLVECAVHAWHRKRRNVALDDCSAIVLFFNLTLLYDTKVHSFPR